MLARIVIWLLRSSRLKGDRKTAVMAALLENIHAMPLRDIVGFDQDGTMLIAGKKLDAEQAISFSESVNGLKNSYARKILHSQMTFNAITIGIHQAMTPEQVQFSKAVLWVIQEENRLIESISSE